MNSRTKAVDLRLNLSGFFYFYMRKTIFLKSDAAQPFQPKSHSNLPPASFRLLPSRKAIVMHTKKPNQTCDCLQIIRFFNLRHSFSQPLFRLKRQRSKSKKRLSILFYSYDSSTKYAARCFKCEVVAQIS